LCVPQGALRFSHLFFCLSCFMLLAYYSKEFCGWNALTGDGDISSVLSSVLPLSSP
jgi:hypothetical protein